MMTLSEDELREVFEKYVRSVIDGAQAMNYYLDSKYAEGDANLLKSKEKLDEIMNISKD